jgi:hypothetical protein
MKYQWQIFTPTPNNNVGISFADLRFHATIKRQILNASLVCESQKYLRVKPS